MPPAEAADGKSNASTKRARVDTAACAGLRLGGPKPRAPSEWGWAGVAFSPDCAALALCHQLSRSLALFDPATGQPTREVSLAQHPRALAWLDPRTLALAEYNAVTLWDLRERGRAALRQQPSQRGVLHCVTALRGAAAGQLAAAGDDRMAYVLDPRGGLKVTKRWRCPCKYDVTSAHASESGLLFISGLDNELLTCDLDAKAEKRRQRLGSASGASSGAVPDTALTSAAGDDDEGRLQQAHSLGVRGDARWVGVSVHGDSVLALCSSGTLCLLKDAHLARAAS